MMLQMLLVKLTNGGNDWETAELIVERPISIVSGADNSFFVDIYSPDDAAHALMMKLEQSGANEYIELSRAFPRCWLEYSSL